MYRPHLDDTCCPPFTIRLDARAFTPTKSQRKVERRWRRYLDGELDDDGKLSVEDEGEVQAVLRDGRLGGGEEVVDERAPVRACGVGGLSMASDALRPIFFDICLA